jgi:UDP-glucose 4-epimerase
MRVLVTGGAGYIGTHTLVELLSSGHSPVVLDNLSNGSAEALYRVEGLTGSAVPLCRADIRDREAVDRAFTQYGEIDAVIHLAGLKAVGESVSNPAVYYENNVAGSLNLISAMEAFNCRRLIFSSSASVYGETFTLPLRENAPLSPASPYARTKLQVEQMLADIGHADSRWRIALLRYFNPVGAHPSGEIGESPRGTPNNLMPYIIQVAAGLRQKLNVFGGDYPTADGTGVRDYIHVMDLARGHVRALEVLDDLQVTTLNLGRGEGYSVLEVLRTFERVSGLRIPYEIVARRAGDVAQCYADPTLAQQLLAWRAGLDLEQMCRDAWNWQCAGAFLEEARGVTHEPG